MLARLDAEFTGSLGVVAADLLSGRRLAYRADELFPMASTIKLAILLQIARRVSEAHLDWGQRVRIDAANRVAGAGILKDLDPGLLLTVRDLATLMVAISDNTAANQCIDLVGVEPVNASLQEWGCAATALHRKISFAPNPSPPHFGTGTPRDFARLMERLGRGELLPRHASEVVLDILRCQQLTDLVARYLPYDALQARELPDQVLTLYSKSGWISGVRNDVALVRAEGVCYVVAIFTRDCQDQRSGPENEGAIAVARASRIVWELFGGQTSDVYSPSTARAMVR